MEKRRRRRVTLPATLRWKRRKKTTGFASSSPAANRSSTQNELPFYSAPSPLHCSSWEAKESLNIWKKTEKIFSLFMSAKKKSFLFLTKCLSAFWLQMLYPVVGSYFPRKRKTSYDCLVIAKYGKGLDKKEPGKWRETNHPVNRE